MTKIIVADEKHGHRYFDASTQSAIYQVALKLVREREKLGWYLWEAPSLVRNAMTYGVNAWDFLQYRNSGNFDGETVLLVELEEP